jgi:two-component system, cell cycle sensor histidine kinase and response regulator CckA
VTAPRLVLLVVDDEPIVLHMMDRTLLDAGYEVHVAGGGPEAIALAGQLQRPLDLVVTDLRMDPIGGAELAEVLFSRGLASRFLFVSGFGRAAEYNEDFGPLLAKPFSSEELLGAVSLLLV